MSDYLTAVTEAARDIKTSEAKLHKAVIAALHEGHTVAAVARAANVSRNTIYEWQKQEKAEK